MLTLPREIALAPDGRIRVYPARELDALRGAQNIRETGHATPDAARELGETGRSFDVTARLYRSADGRAAAALRLLTSTDGAEYLDIALDPVTGELVVDRTHASREPRARRGSWRIPRTTEPGGYMTLRAIIDHSIVEVFLSTGETLTLRFYPMGNPPWRLQARSTGTGSAAFDVRSWQLNPIRVRHDDPESGHDHQPATTPVSLPRD